MNTEDRSKYTVWGTVDDGKTIPFTDLNIPVEFVMEHSKGSLIAEDGDSSKVFLLPAEYDMLTIMALYKNYKKELAPEENKILEVTDCVTYKYLAIPVSYILENFAGVEIYHNDDGKKVLELPDNQGIEDIIRIYKIHMINSIIESLKP